MSCKNTYCQSQSLYRPQNDILSDLTQNYGILTNTNISEPYITELINPYEAPRRR